MPAAADVVPLLTTREGHERHEEHGGHDLHGGAEAASAWAAVEVVVLVLGVGAVVGYLAAVHAAGRRGRGWSRLRTAGWSLGCLLATAALVGPLARAAHESLTAHMGAHLLLGMVAPVLLCRAAPVTLLLRALPAAGARRVTRLLGWRPVRVVTHPLVAAALDAGGLWLLYATDLYPRMHASPVVHLAVHAHVLVAGYLFTASVVGVDPDPHRPSLRVRLLVLVLFTAAHAVLAKWLYAHPPDGVAVDDAERGSQLMYYGGDAVHLVLFVLLLRVWYDAGPRGVGRHHLPGGQCGRPLGWSRAARALLPGGSRSRPRGAGRGRPPGGQVPAA